MAEHPVGRLAGRRAIITGAGSGIGKATAELFAAEGARLSLFDRNSEAVDAVAQRLGASWQCIDVANEEGVKAAVRLAADSLGGIDAVINAAGTAVPAKLAETTLRDWHRVLDVNLTGPFLICREALPWLEREPRATIVNVSSGSALLPVGMAIASYVASKAGLVALTKAMAYELAPGIRANTVCPGAVDTPLLPDVIRARAAHPQESPYALRRVAQPHEIAQAILYLTSDESAYVTGVALAVDGGRTYH